MKKKSMFIAFGAAAVMAAGVLAGCGGSTGGEVKETETTAETSGSGATDVTETAAADVTVESIAKSVSENMKEVKSYALNGGINMKYGVKAQDTSMEMAAKTIIDGESVLETKNTHITMDMDMNMLGADYKMTNEAYGLVGDDGKYITYNKSNNPLTGEDDEKWVKNETESPIDFEALNNMDIFRQIADGKIQAVLSDETVQVNGKDAYKITGTIPGEVFQEVFTNMYGSNTSNTDVTAMDFSKASADAELYVYKDSLLPAKTYMDAKAYMETILKESMAQAGNSLEGMEFTIDEFNVETTMDKYNEIDKIEIPEEVIKEAEESAAQESAESASEAETAAEETSQAS